MTRLQTRAQTGERRKSQSCKTYEVKFDKSHLSNEKQEWLNRLFLEAKWLYNDIIGSEDIFKYDTKLKEVHILNKDKELELRNLQSISSQMKQSIRDRIISSIKALATKNKKRKQGSVGKLKFKSYMNSIPLKQFKATYKIENNYVRLQNCKKRFKVIGLKQIPENAEFANAHIIKKHRDYYLKITCFLPKKERLKTGEVIGLDFGIKNSITDSNGIVYNYQFPETREIKKASSRLHRCKKSSKNRFKAKLALQKTYANLTNVKKDAKNKFISKLKKNYDVICIQDENIKGWHSSKMKGFGRRVQHSIMGGIISEIKKFSETIVVDKYFPSTKLCPVCGILNELSLNDRIYTCICGYSLDRDIHSARNILKIGMEHINTMLVEKMLDLPGSIRLPSKQSSLKQEAQVLKLG